MANSLISRMVTSVIEKEVQKAVKALLAKELGTTAAGVKEVKAVKEKPVKEEKPKVAFTDLPIMEGKVNAKGDIEVNGLVIIRSAEKLVVRNDKATQTTKAFYVNLSRIKASRQDCRKQGLYSSWDETTKSFVFNTGNKQEQDQIIQNLSRQHRG